MVEDECEQLKLWNEFGAGLSNMIS